MGIRASTTSADSRCEHSAAAGVSVRSSQSSGNGENAAREHAVDELNGIRVARLVGLRPTGTEDMGSAGSTARIPTKPGRRVSSGSLTASVATKPLATSSWLRPSRRMAESSPMTTRPSPFWSEHIFVV